MIGHELFLCLGGNLGNKAEIFPETLRLIRWRIGSLLKLSSVYSSPAYGFVSEFEFWNQVVQVQTNLSPYSVLERIRKIEDHFDRKREPGVYLSRQMDIDILFYDQLVLKSPRLTIPHPSLADRNFVLVPLVEISPGLVHPVTGKTVEALLANCPDTSGVVRV